MGVSIFTSQDIGENITPFIANYLKFPNIYLIMLYLVHSFL
jgi:hypothetical protein